MKVQNYQNHVRYYTPHHFVFYPVVGLLFLVCLAAAFMGSEKALWFMLALVWLVVGLLSYMLRQHYALINQNRTVRLEMRLRYYVLTQQRLELVENALSLPQLFALRFASDEELPALIERTIKENLSPDQIKRSINTWKPDYMRV